MTVAPLKLLVDENVPAAILAWLRAEGHDVTAAGDAAPGAPDADWAAASAASGRLIVTADKDFGGLIYRNKLAVAGVVLLRLAGPVPDRLARVREAWGVVEANPSGAFVVISMKRVRVRPIR